MSTAPRSLGRRATPAADGLALPSLELRLVWISLLAVMLLAGGCARAGDGALGLHHDAIVVDTHSDTTPWFQDPAWRFDERHERGHMDLPRMREGGLDVQFWSIYMGETPGPGRAIREALERIDAVHETAARHSDEVELASSVSDIRRIVREGRIAFLMGVEGGHIIEESLAALRTFYRLGVRYLTLTHSFHTSWADSSGTREALQPLHHGLSAFGEEVVAEMNRLGMMVDVSHVSDETFWDVLRVSRASLQNQTARQVVRPEAHFLLTILPNRLRRFGRSVFLVVVTLSSPFSAAPADRDHGTRMDALAPEHLQFVPAWNSWFRTK